MTSSAKSTYVAPIIPITTFTPDTLALLKRIYAALNNTYFDKQGRYCHRIPTTFTPAEIKSLGDAGLTPNTFLALPHDTAVTRLRTAARAIDLRRAADAFVASLTTADLAWQAVLPAAALGLAVPEHAMVNPMSPDNHPRCRTCFYCDEAHDVTLRAYFAHIQGTGFSDINGGPVEPLLTLERALAIPPADWPTPTPRDIWVFHRILDIIREQPPATRYGAIRTHLKKSALLSHNSQYRCETTLEALAHLGLLETPDRPGLFTRFTPAVERDQRPNTRVEVPAPLGWWNTDDGINEKLLARLFGHLPLPATEPPTPKPPATKKKNAHTSSTNAATNNTHRIPRSIPSPVAAGDIYAIRYREDLWGAVYCHEVTPANKAPVRGRVEYLNILSPTFPDAAALSTTSLRFRDRLNGERWQAWARALDKTTGIRRIATGVPAPAHTKPIPDRIPYAQGSELCHLASWNFKEL